jgi:hypothetical protein
MKKAVIIMYFNDDYHQAQVKDYHAQAAVRYMID